MNFPKIALAGTPNSGKTALFNAITGGRQKVGNYPGVTVERKEGTVTTATGITLKILDLPGTYSLDAYTPDEAVTRDVLLGKEVGESLPDVLIAVADVTNLERNLGLILELRDLGLPVVLALNMMDLAEKRGMKLDFAILERELKLPIIPTVATRKLGIEELISRAAGMVQTGNAPATPKVWTKPASNEVRNRFQEVDRVLKLAIVKNSNPAVWTDWIDAKLLHPFWGLLFLTAIVALIFQAVFTWAGPPADAIEAGVAALGAQVGSFMPEGALKSLLVDGIIAGVGSVLVFLPQILLLFLFILILEDSGYMARAAFLMDRVMGKVGLHGRAFIPLLSSFACAIPGIMATRTIGNPRDRLTTILVAPLTTCSARLPVYTLLISAFIPNAVVWGPIRMQGLVMFGLYLAGILAPLTVALILKKTVLRGPKPPLLIELPTYKRPSLRNILMGLLERSRLFLKRAGTVILSLSVLLWFLASYPKVSEEMKSSGQPAIESSFAGKIGHAIEPLLRPLGFDWRISIALIPGFAAREVMVSALGTVYAIEAKAGSGENAEAEVEAALSERLSKDWPLATALSLLVWYIFAPQCLSTLAVIRRETNSWRWPLFNLFYMTVLAYLGSWVTFTLTRSLGG